MRFALAGSIVRPAPVVIQFSANDTFLPAGYITDGYAYFDVICIGGGGGMGGGIDTDNTGTLVRSFGGAGGGGGVHRVQGLLSALPEECPVVVGAGGALGDDHISDPDETTDGGDGGYSSFNDTTCRASGGRGGSRVQSNSVTVATEADGGEGGIGDRIIAGGGGSGGTAGIPTSTGPGTPGTNGEDGSWNGFVGAGGGGGAGGVGKYGGITCNAATAGGRGAYNPGDISMLGPGGAPSTDVADSGAANVVPGGASGAQAALLTGNPTVYGQSASRRTDGQDGVVIIRIVAA